MRAAPKDVQQNWSVEDIKRVGKEAQTGAMREPQAALPVVPGPPDAGRVQSAILNAHLALKAVDNADLQAVRKGLNADQIAQAIEHIDASLGRLHKLHAVLRGL